MNYKGYLCLDPYSIPFIHLRIWDQILQRPIVIPFSSRETWHFKEQLKPEFPEGHLLVASMNKHKTIYLIVLPEDIIYERSKL